MTVATRWLLAIILVLCFGQIARAESCAKSLDYILNDLPGDLPEPPVAYRNLLNVCLQTSIMANVKEAYVLKNGGIAVIPKNDSVFGTANILADFCRKFPRNVLRFITRREVRQGLTTGLVVLMSSANSDLCNEIRGKR
jgi:hypothetical protein